MEATTSERRELASVPACHPAHAPYARWLQDLPRVGVPPVERLNAWAREAELALPGGRALRFDRSEPSASALDFERRVAVEGVIGIRADSTHDAWNALVWLAFPRAKAALNEVHVREGASPAANARSPARDAETLLDESGLIVACRDAELAALLRAHAWRDLFVERRDQVRVVMHAYAIGHGLLDRMARPYRALTAKVLIVPASATDAEVDTNAAAAIRSPDFGPASLTPLPVAALPGWDTENLGAQLFGDAGVFRPARASLTRSEDAQA